MNKEIQKRHEKLLNKLEIKYIKLPELEICCGLPALNAGYRDDFQSIISKNTQLLRNQNIKKIIVSCPSCYRIFKRYYNIDVKYIGEILLENIEKLGKNYNEEVTYFDPCNPDRIEMLYNTPRDILGSVGFKIVELKDNKKESRCCGFALQGNTPKIATVMAQDVLDRVKTKKLITSCPNCFTHLTNNAYEIKIMELSEVLV